MLSIRNDVREAMGADSSWRVFFYRSVFNVITVLFFVGAIVGFAIAGRPDQLQWGSTQAFCSCKPVTYANVRITPQFAFCIATIKPSIKAYPAIKFTGDYSRATRDAEVLGEFNAFAGYLFNASAPLTRDADCDGLSLDEFRLRAEISAGNGQTVVDPVLRVPVAPSSTSCRRSASAGNYRNVVIYNNSYMSPDFYTSRVEAPWNQQIRLETEQYAMTAMTIINFNEPELHSTTFARLLAALTTCFNVLDDFVPVHECMCPLTVVNNAVAVTSIFVTATLPLRVLAAARASRLAREEGKSV